MRTAVGAGAANVERREVFGLFWSRSLCMRDVEDRLRLGWVSDRVMPSDLTGDGECSDLDSGDVGSGLLGGVDPVDNATSLLLRREDDGLSSAGGASATICTGNRTFCGGEGSGVGGSDDLRSTESAGRGCEDGDECEDGEAKLGNENWARSRLAELFGLASEGPAAGSNDGGGTGGVTTIMLDEEVDCLVESVDA